MLSVRTRIKLNKVNKSIRKHTDKILYFILKPLLVLEDKIKNYKYEKIKIKAKELTDEQAIDIIAKNIIKNLTKNINFSWNYECFDLSSEWDNKDIFKYASNMKNKVINEWEYNRCKAYKDMDNTIVKLTEMLRVKMIEEYPEVNCYYYQRNDYTSKCLIIKLKEV